MTKPEILSYPEISPNNKAQKLVVFLHGLGSDGNDLIALAPFFKNKIKDAHYISPHGIEPCDMAPYGRQWFSLIDRSPEIVTELAGRSAKHLEAIIKDKQEELGLTNEDTILIGFSQGTMIGTYIALSQDEPFAAMIAYSGLLVSPPKIKNKQTPVCIVHGKQDDLVPMSESEDMGKFFDKEGIANEVMMIENLHHSINAEGIQFAAYFLDRYIKEREV